MNIPVFSRYVRRVHMYLALFLVPWILMYSLSSLVFNHFGTIRDWYGRDLKWKIPQTRRWGWVAIGAGIVSFTGLLWAL